jgi:hypothetical protein
MKRSISVLVLLAGGIILLSACGEVRLLPAVIEPQDYPLIAYEQLLDPGPAGLKAGQKIKVPAYFWEFLSYDPAMVSYYLTLARHPLSWYKLQWFALYGTEDMKGYYDLAALAPDQRKLYSLKRLDHIMVYGELASLGSGLYLHVHHMEKIEED